MSQSFSRNEINVLLQLPVYVAIAILLAEENDPVEFLQQVRCAAKALVRARQQQETFSDLAARLSAVLLRQGGEAQLQPDEEFSAKEYELLHVLQNFGSSTEGRQMAIAHCAQAAAILAKKLPGEMANAYCRWAVYVARSVADSLLENRDTPPSAEHVHQIERVLVDLKAALNAAA